jgi:ribosomal protein S18 acetylase RimI-like enzyme
MGVAVAVCADASAEALEAALDRADSGMRRHHVTAVRAAPLTGELLAELAEELGVQREEVVVLRAGADGPPGWAVHAVPAGESPLPDLLPPHRAVQPLGPAEPRDERAVAALGIRVRFPEQEPAGAGLESLRTAGHAFEINDWQAGPAEFAVLAADPEHLVLVAELADADGEHGPVGLAVLRLTAGSAHLLAFRVAARAAGRLAERALLAELLDRAARRGAASVLAAVRDLGRNAPAVQFFAALGIAAGAQPQPLPPYPWPTGVVREETSDD